MRDFRVELHGVGRRAGLAIAAIGALAVAAVGTNPAGKFDHLVAVTHPDIEFAVLRATADSDSSDDRSPRRMRA